METDSHWQSATLSLLLSFVAALGTNHQSKIHYSFKKPRFMSCSRPKTGGSRSRGNNLCIENIRQLLLCVSRANSNHIWILQNEKSINTSIFIGKIDLRTSSSPVFSPKFRARGPCVHEGWKPMVLLCFLCKLYPYKSFTESVKD